ncbi:hypothetical protein PL373_13460 [Tenacibaculum maritimum]|nr:hypothetical protein [Tenacibaculum maritimum]MDB0602137.1 hypothetical protein [Tenacibaculum maritimum]MDB0613812.1 hypothetical protein [Tenacibaculum maritimum]
MTSTEGTVLLIEKVKVSRKKKGLPDTERMDLILLPENREKPCRFQVRRECYSLLEGIEPKDKVEVYYVMELNEIERNGEKKRFDNNILENIKKVV